jgi:hypothetical protein
MSTVTRGVAHGLPYVLQIDPDLVPETAHVRVAGVDIGFLNRCDDGRWHARGFVATHDHGWLDLTDAANDICEGLVVSQQALSSHELIVRQNLERDAEWTRVLKAAQRERRREEAQT